MMKRNGHKSCCIAACIFLVILMLAKEAHPLKRRVKRNAPMVHNVYALDYFIELVEKIEKKVTKIYKVVEHIRSFGYNDDYWQTIIGKAEALPNGILTSNEKDALTKMVAHQYTGSRELGVVRTSSGETIAIGHVINGINAGIFRDYERSLNTWASGTTKVVDNVYAATLARDLAESTLAKKNTPSKEYFGPGGSWDSEDCPDIYTRSAINTDASNAELLGSVDGLLLGHKITAWVRKVRLGQLLRMYYSTGVCFDKAFASCKRYTTFNRVVYTNKEDTYVEVVGVAEALYLKNSGSYHNVKKEDIKSISKAVVDQFLPYLQKIHGNQQCPTNQPGCELPANLVFVMDESGSIRPNHFEDEKSFVSQTINAFNISPRQTKVAAIEFGDSASIDIKLNDYGSKTRLKCVVKRMTLMGGRTNTASALDLARTGIFLPLQDGESSKKSESNIVILLTDGQSNKPSTTAIYPAIQRIKGQVKDLTMIAIGVGNYKSQELNAIATDPHKHVFTASSFHELLNYVKALQNRTCTTPVNMNLNFKQEGNTTEVIAFVSPEKVRYFILAADHFFGVDIRIKITPVHGTIKLYASRISEIPGPNDFEYKLDPIPNGQSLQLHIADPCSGHSNATTCPPLFLGIYHAESVECTCTEPECFLPGQIKFKIEIGTRGIGSKNQASIFLFFSTLALIYIF